MNTRFAALMASLVLLGAGCFSGTATTAADGGLWKTTDFGESYESLKTLPQLDGVTSIAGVNVRKLEIDPNDESVYYLSTVANGFFYSVDFGVTWQRPETEEMRSGEILDITIDPKNTCTLYVVKGSRLYKSEDCARSFEVTYTEGGAATTLSRVVVDWFNSQIVYLGNTDGDLLKSIDGGYTWVSVLRTKNAIAHIMISNADSRIVLVGTTTAGVHRTEDAGATWVDLESDMKKAFPKSGNVYGFDQLYDGSLVLMNCGYGLLHSEDAGKTWTAYTLVTSPSEVRIWDAALDPKDRNRLYYATYGKLFISENGGNTWRNVALPSKRAPWVVQPHPKSPQTLLFGFRTIEEK